MNRIKIAYFDIDGALVDFYAGQSAPQILEPLPRLQQAGKGKIDLPGHPACAHGAAAFFRDRVRHAGFGTIQTVKSAAEFSDTR